MSDTQPLMGTGTRPAIGSTQAWCVKYFLCIVGFLYFGWGVTQLILTGTGPCAARWSVATHYRGSDATGFCVANQCTNGITQSCVNDGDCLDDLGLGDAYANQYTQSQFTNSILLGIAGVVLGVSYCWQQWSWTGDTPPWDETKLQIHNRFRPSRWVTWGITFALIFAVGSFYAGVLDVWLIVVLSIQSVPLHYLQSANEAMNTDYETHTATQNPKTADVQYLKTKTALKDSWFVDKLPRIEAWLTATIIFVVIGLVWFFHLGYANAASGGNAAMNGFAISIPIVIYVVYFVQHLAILWPLTNYGVKYWDPNPYYREYFFFASKFLIYVYVSVVSVAVSNIAGGSCAA